MNGIISRHFRIINRIVSRRYRYLLLSLICMIFIPQFFEGNAYQNHVSFIFRSAVVFTGIVAVHETKFQLRAGVLLGLVVVVINQLGIFRESLQIDFYLSFIIYIFFYCFLAYKLLKMVLKSKDVTLGVLYAAVIIYLLLGVIGGFAFMLIENSQPNSLANLTIENLKDPSRFFYFSFTTLSTLGYGDITPLTPASQSLSIILSTTGPLYLTILVAMLVSRFNQNQKS